MRAPHLLLSPGSLRALSWTGRFETGGKKQSEYQTRVLGEKDAALVFMIGPAERVEALRPAFDRLIETIRLP